LKVNEDNKGVGAMFIHDRSIRADESIIIPYGVSKGSWCNVEVDVTEHMGEAVVVSDWAWWAGYGGITLGVRDEEAGLEFTRDGDGRPREGVVL
jgi:hypothetical protein